MADVYVSVVNNKNIIAVIFGGKLHSRISSEYKGNECDYTLKQSFHHRHAKTMGSYTLVMAISWTWGPKDCFANRQLLFTAFVLLLRLVVKTSRQCSKKICRGRHISRLCQSRKFPRDYQKDLNKEGCCTSRSHLQTGSETDETEQAAMMHWWNSLFANITETILPLLHYMLTNTTEIFPHTVCTTSRVQTITHLQKTLLLLCSCTTTIAVELGSLLPLKQSPFVHFSLCPEQPAPWLPSGLLGCSFGFPVGSCFDLGHLHICQGVRGKAWAHAFNGLLVNCPLLLQRANHVLHFALPRKEVLYARLQCLNLLPCSLEGHRYCTSVNTGHTTKDRG